MTSKRTLGEWVIEYPAAAKVFHLYDLDFCCGGNQFLDEACAAKGLDPAIVSGEIEAATINLKDIRWDQQPVAALVRHITERYHAPLKTELPRLIDLARKVERVHGDKTECPRGLAEILSEVQVTLECHLVKEEQYLFPRILSDTGPSDQLPIQEITKEHEEHGAILRRLRAYTHNRGLPASACASWRELYRSLEVLETDLMDHIHLENNILFAGLINKL